MHQFRTLCILDVLFYKAYSARYSIFVLMCRGVGRVVRWCWGSGPTILITVGQGPIALAVDAGGGCSGGAMVLGKLPVPGRPTVWITVGQGLTALAVGAGGGCLDIFTLICPFSSLSPSLWETARYRLKYCVKELLNPKQPTNQSNSKGR